jgi:hypothetical protein
VHERSASGRPHKAGVAQDPQVLRDGALGDSELRGKRADAEGSVADQAKDAQAHLDGEGFQKT